MWYTDPFPAARSRRRSLEVFPRPWIGGEGGFCLNVNRIVRILVPILVLLTVMFFFAQSKTGMFHMGDGPERYQLFAASCGLHQQQQRAGWKFRQGHVSRALHEGQPGAFSCYLGTDNPPERQDTDEPAAFRHGVKDFGYTKPPISDSMTGLLVSVLLPLVVIFFFWMFFLRQAQSGRQPGPVVWTLARQAAQRQCPQSDV